MKKATRAIAAATCAAGIILTGSACGYVNVPPGQRAVVVDGYWMIPTDPTIKGCIEPENNQNEITNDVYRYPARQISWDATGAQGSERAPYKVVSNISAPAELNVPVVVTMDLTGDCELLKEFHKDFGTKYQGWLKEDGSPSDGWIQLLNYVVGQPTEQTLVSIAQKYPWREIWNNEKVRAEFQAALQNGLQHASAQRTNGKEFFINFQVMVLKPDPVDQNLKDAINREQSAIAEANALRAKGVGEAEAAKAKAEAELAAAVAETEVARQNALKRQAEIAGFPSIDAYLKDLAIKQGLNPFQPVIVPGMPK